MISHVTSDTLSLAIARCHNQRVETETLFNKRSNQMSNQQGNGINRFLVIIMALAQSVGVVGCATQAKYERKLDNWLGRDVNELFMSNGAPTREFKLPNGYIQYVYVVTAGSETYTYNNRALSSESSSTTDLYCETTFTVKNEIIMRYQFQGTMCVSYS